MNNIDLTKYGFVKTSEADETPDVYTLEQKGSSLQLTIDGDICTLYSIKGDKKTIVANKYKVQHQSIMDFLIFNSPFYNH